MIQNTSAIQNLVIVASGTPDGEFRSVEDIDRLHRQWGVFRSRSLSPYHSPRLRHIAAHFVIYTNGAVVCGRHEREAIRGYPDSILVCLVGQTRFTASQWETLRKHVELKRKVRPRLTVRCGRRPVFDVNGWLAGVMLPLSEHLIPRGKP